LEQGSGQETTVKLISMCVTGGRGHVNFNPASVETDNLLAKLSAKKSTMSKSIKFQNVQFFAHRGSLVNAKIFK
jgi:ABC-type polar amino acid transport system ATPase subunit